MRRNVIHNVIHTNNIYLKLVIRFLHIQNVVLTENTASDTIPTVLASCGIYSYGFRVMSTC